MVTRGRDGLSVVSLGLSSLGVVGAGVVGLGVGLGDGLGVMGAAVGLGRGLRRVLKVGLTDTSGTRVVSWTNTSSSSGGKVSSSTSVGWRVVSRGRGVVSTGRGRGRVIDRGVVGLGETDGRVLILTGPDVGLSA